MAWWYRYYFCSMKTWLLPMKTTTSLLAGLENRKGTIEIWQKHILPERNTFTRRLAHLKGEGGCIVCPTKVGYIGHDELMAQVPANWSVRANGNKPGVVLVVAWMSFCALAITNPEIEAFTKTLGCRYFLLQSFSEPSLGKPKATGPEMAVKNSWPMCVNELFLLSKVWESWWTIGGQTLGRKCRLHQLTIRKREIVVSWWNRSTYRRRWTCHWSRWLCGIYPTW